MPRLSEVSDTPLLDVILLSTKALDCTREELLLHGNKPIDELPSLAEQEAKARLATLESMLARRCEGTPVAYLIGHKEFRSLDFSVEPGVLVPRADTEILVEVALAEASRLAGQSATKENVISDIRDTLDIHATSANASDTGDTNAHASNANAREQSLKLIDVCTGSGAIAISLAAELAEAGIAAEVHATDLSPLALKVAQKNNEQLLPEYQRVYIHRGDLLLAGDKAGCSWDLVISNPPYLLDEECIEIAGKGWGEPDMALRGGDCDGLALIRRLIEQATTRLNNHAILALEAAPEQMDEIERLLCLHGFTHIKRAKDLAGDERAIWGQWNTP